MMLFFFLVIILLAILFIQSPPPKLCLIPMKIKTKINFFQELRARNKEKFITSLSSTLLNQYNNVSVCDGDFALQCSTPFCDCSELCKNSSFSRRYINPGEKVIYNSHILNQGKTYCLKDVSAIRSFLRWKYMPVFSNGKWDFIDINVYYSENPCKNPTISEDENVANILWDLKNDKQVTDINVSNLEELIETDGKKEPRYQCKCNGKDIHGNRLIGIKNLPSLCLPDPCKKYLKHSGNFLKGLDVESGECECGEHYKNFIISDKRTVCTFFPLSFKDNKLSIPTECWSDIHSTPITDTFIKYPCEDQFVDSIEKSVSLNIAVIAEEDGKDFGRIQKKLSTLSRTELKNFLAESRLRKIPTNTYLF